VSVAAVFVVVVVVVVVGCWSTALVSLEVGEGPIIVIIRAKLWLSIQFYCFVLFN
jgi:hypothetical protein